MPTSDACKDSGLIRGLGIWAATAVVIGGMIGQSVFLVASDMSREVGSMTMVMAAWLVGGVVALFGAFCFAELGAAIPEPGGEYAYLSRGVGRMWGFLYGWTGAMILKPGVAAVIAAGLLRFLAFLLPSVTAPIFAWPVRLPFQAQPYQLTFTVAQPLAAGLVAVVTGINYLGVRTAGRLQVVLTALKVAAVAAILGLGLTARGFDGAQSSFVTTSAHGAIGGFLIALVPVMAAYNGFQNLGSVGSEVLNPGKNLPRAAVLGTSIVIPLYLLVNWVYFHILGFSQVAQSQHVASDAVTLMVGRIGAKWFTVAMIVSAFGTLHAIFLTGPRVPYAMARDGNFFGFAKRIHPRFRTPSGAVVFQGCVATLLALTGTHQELYSYAMFATSAFMALTAVALIRLRITSPELPRTYRAWGYPFTPLIFGAVSFALSVNLWIVRPVRSSIGLAIILVGVPFFHHWRSRTRSSIASAVLICTEQRASIDRANGPVEDKVFELQARRDSKQTASIGHGDAQP
jgi:APA family basic amino acid/polyamine antiporter